MKRMLLLAAAVLCSAPVKSQEVLWNQNTDTSNISITSQNFEASFDAYDNQGPMISRFQHYSHGRSKTSKLRANTSTVQGQQRHSASICTSCANQGHAD